MKTFILAMMLSTGVMAQTNVKTYQSGCYPRQSHWKFEKITGTVIEKYKNNGFYWLTVVKGNTTYKISMADIRDYDLVPLDQPNTTIDCCFKIFNKQWKRKKLK